MASDLDAHAPAAHTNAVRRVLAQASDQSVVADLLFLESWEEKPVPGSAALLRVRQLHRAQQALVAEVRREIIDQRHSRRVPRAWPGPEAGTTPV